MYPILFNIGNIPIYSFGMSIIIGITLGLYIMIIFMQRDSLDTKLFVKYFSLLFFLSVIGGRIFHVIFRYDNFVDSIYKALFIWDGGISMWGFIITFFIIFHYILVRNNKTVSRYLDVLSLSFLATSTIIFLGQFAGGQGFGKTTNFFMGVLFDNINSPFAGVKVHPTSLYLSIICLILFILMLIIWLVRIRPFYGFIYYTTVVIFCLFHILTENLRWDITYWFFGYNGEKTISIIVLILVSIYLSITIWQLYGNKIKKHFPRLFHHI